MGKIINLREIQKSMLSVLSSTKKSSRNSSNEKKSSSFKGSMLASPRRKLIFDRLSAGVLKCHKEENKERERSNSNSSEHKQANLIQVARKRSDMTLKNRKKADFKSMHNVDNKAYLKRGRDRKDLFGNIPIKRSALDYDPYNDIESSDEEQKTNMKMAKAKSWLPAINPASPRSCIMSV